MGGPKGQELPKFPIDPTPTDISPWFSLAKQAVGQHEVAGRAYNQFILDCFHYTSYKASDDSIPWCAAFVCRMLEESGFKSTKSAAAISYADFGKATNLASGAILVFKWQDGGHHVTFCDHIVDASQVACLGGNQSDSVKVSVYPRSAIVAVRWPVDKLAAA